jgi:type II secretory pathway component PulC
MEPVDSLSLVGTMLNQQNGNKAVILDETEQQQYILSEGEKVTESIVVQKVERGRVVLLRNGQEEVLFLKNRKGRGTPDTAAPRMPLVPYPSTPVIKNKKIKRRFLKDSQWMPPATHSGRWLTASPWWSPDIYSAEEVF